MEDKLIVAHSLRRLLSTKKTAICAALSLETLCTTKFGNYIARRGDKLSFLPAGKQHEVNADGSWKRTNRQDIKPAKLIQKLLRPEIIRQLGITNKDLEDFANLIKASQANDEDFGFTFHLVQGEDIRHYYNQSNYSLRHSTGSVSESCMRYPRCQGYLDIYVHNSNSVSLLVLLDKEAKAVGRALVWKVDPDIVILDRIYASDANTEVFKDYARKNGWLHKTYQNANCNWFTDPDGKSTDDLFFNIHLDRWKFSLYPFLDTFRYLDMDHKLLTNSVRESSPGWISLTSTDGDTRLDNLIWSEYNQGYIDSTRAVYVDQRAFVWTHQAYRDENGNWRLKPDMIVLIDGTQHPKKDSIELKGVGWIRSSQRKYYRYVRDRRTYYPLNDVVLVSGTRMYIHRDDMTILGDGSFCHRKDAVFHEPSGTFQKGRPNGPLADDILSGPTTSLTVTRHTQPNSSSSATSNSIPEPVPNVHTPAVIVDSRPSDLFRNSSAA